MNTKEAIEFIEAEIIYWGPTVCTTMKKKPYVAEAGNPLVVKLYKEIIILLKCGEENKKYKQMWNELDDELYKSLEEEMGYDVKNRYQNVNNIVSLMTTIKQKYFPKEK